MKPGNPFPDFGLFVIIIVVFVFIRSYSGFCCDLFFGEKPQKRIYASNAFLAFTELLLKIKVR